MGLKVIEKIQEAFDEGGEIGRLFGRKYCDDHWPDIKLYIDTVEELDQLDSKFKYPGSPEAVTERNSLKKKLNEIRKRLGAV